MKKRVLLGITGLMGLIIVYVFQRDLFYQGFMDAGASTTKVENFDLRAFSLGKIIRFLINDGCSLMIIAALFWRKDFMQFGFRLFLIELGILLPLYIVLVASAYEETRFFLQHLHRLVVNPVLMMLLIPAFVYQQHQEKHTSQ